MVTNLENLLVTDKNISDDMRKIVTKFIHIMRRKVLNAKDSKSRV
jgi:hypothetical protein